MLPEELVEPLDAYVTAKPDEPVFTLQGGDPLAPPLVRLWALVARVRAGVLPARSVLVEWVTGIKEVAESHSLADNEHEQKNLLIRATMAEEVSWHMDEYQSESIGAELPTEAGENFLDEKARIDLHDLKVRAAQRLSNFHSEMMELRQALLEQGGFFCGEHDPVDEDWLALAHGLKALSDLVEPRRVMKRKSKHAR